MISSDIKLSYLEPTFFVLRLSNFLDNRLFYDINF